MNDEQLHDYTELVIEIWDAYTERGYTLSDMVDGGFREGIDYVSKMACRFLEDVGHRESQGFWWDGGWIAAVQGYAQHVVDFHPPSDWIPMYDVTKFMESPDTNPDKETK